MSVTVTLNGEPMVKSDGEAWADTAALARRDWTTRNEWNERTGNMSVSNETLKGLLDDIKLGLHNAHEKLNALEAHYRAAEAKTDSALQALMTSPVSLLVLVAAFLAAAWLGATLF